VCEVFCIYKGLKVYWDSDCFSLQASSVEHNDTVGLTQSYSPVKITSKTVSTRLLVH